mmetsp:Transcript_79587/g.247815  ORF Transcript_79587/g.247815 Transcript_79587/m.247815 type:complete len:404 (+) Transcript_79587:411-1622(+)
MRSSSLSRCRSAVALELSRAERPRAMLSERRRTSVARSRGSCGGVEPALSCPAEAARVRGVLAGSPPTWASPLLLSGSGGAADVWVGPAEASPPLSAVLPLAPPLRPASGASASPGGAGGGVAAAAGRRGSGRKGARRGAAWEVLAAPLRPAAPGPCAAALLEGGSLVIFGRLGLLLPKPVNGLKGAFGLPAGVPTLRVLPAFKAETPGLPALDGVPPTVPPGVLGAVRLGPVGRPLGLATRGEPLGLASACSGSSNLPGDFGEALRAFGLGEPLGPPSAVGSSRASPSPAPVPGAEARRCRLTGVAGARAPQVGRAGVLRPGAPPGLHGGWREARERRVPRAVLGVSTPGSGRRGVLMKGAVYELGVPGRAASEVLPPVLWRPNRTGVEGAWGGLLRLGAAL